MRCIPFRLRPHWLRNRVRLLGVEMHIRLVVSRSDARRLDVLVVCYHRYDSAGSVQLQISLSTRVSLVSTAPQIPPTDVSPPVRRGRSHDNKQKTLNRRRTRRQLRSGSSDELRWRTIGQYRVYEPAKNLPKGDLGAIDAVEPQASRDGCLDSTGSPMGSGVLT